MIKKTRRSTEKDNKKIMNKVLVYFLIFSIIPLLTLIGVIILLVIQIELIIKGKQLGENLKSNPVLSTLLKIGKRRKQNPKK